MADLEGKLDRSMNYLKLALFFGTILIFSSCIFIFLSNSNFTPETALGSSREKYGVICDAGSSGTRIFVYKIAENSENSQNLAKIDTLVRNGKPVVRKVSPGLSSFGNHPEKVVEYFEPLLTFAEANIPLEQIEETPLFIFATAGMRLLPEGQKSAIIENLQKNLQTITKFRIKAENIRIIDGSWEGIYSWISVNYILGNFGTKNEAAKKTVGMIDMGGASVQIAVEIEGENKEKNENVFEINLSPIIKFQIFSATFLGFGANQGLEKYEKSLLSPIDPCSPEGLQKVRITPENLKIETKGSGEWTKCVEKVRNSVRNEKCGAEKCLLNLKTPKGIDLAEMEMFGFSEYWYTTRNFGSHGTYNYTNFVKNINEYCTESWEEIKRKKQNGGFENIEQSRMETNCFKAAWTIAVLHDGFEIDEENNRFQSVLEINGEEMQWALGAMIYHTRNSGILAAEKSLETNRFMITCSYILICTFSFLLAFWLFREYYTKRRKISSYRLVV